MSRHFLPTSSTLGLCACLALFATSADAAKKKPNAPAATDANAFDAKAAGNAISNVDLGKCKVTNAPRGKGHVKITFASTGDASDVLIDSGPWSVTTPVGKCMVRQFKTAKVPAFKGDAVTVGKLFNFGD